MSRYDWERGKVVIPSAAWAPFKKALREGWNAYLTTLMKQAEVLHAHLVTASKGKRNFDYRAEAKAWADRQSRSSSYSSSSSEQAYEVVDYLFAAVRYAGKGRPNTPKKKDFPFATSVTLEYSSFDAFYWEGSCYLNNDRRELEWHVSENNHAVEHAWNHPMGRVVDRALRAVQWTRGSGGKFIGNDEYNRDSDYEDGGGNYVTQRYGPLGAADEYDRPRRRASIRSAKVKR